jgi:hypothetical protein
MTRLDGVEVKVTLDAAQALDVLDLDDKSRLTIWFYDDTSVGQRLRLLTAGVVVRVRVKHGGDGDSTAKLRPCRRSQLTPRWLATTSTDRLEFRVEEDWAGDRRVLAASAQADLEHEVLAEVESRATPPPGLLIRDQQDFLADCASIRVELEATTRLGPIAATRWKSVGNAALSALDVRAERWTVGDLDFLELSSKVEADEAGRTRAALTAALDELGLAVPTDQETKTRQVLEYLAGGPPSHA